MDEFKQRLLAWGREHDHRVEGIVANFDSCEKELADNELMARQINALGKDSVEEELI